VLYPPIADKVEFRLWVENVKPGVLVKRKCRDDYMREISAQVNRTDLKAPSQATTLMHHPPFLKAFCLSNGSTWNKNNSEKYNSFVLEQSRDKKV